MKQVNRTGYWATIATQLFSVFALSQKAITAPEFCGLIIFCTFAGCFFVYQSIAGE